jgi:hypothetical protein
VHDRDGAPARRRIAFLWVGALAAPLLAGCVTEAERSSGGATIAFESIDGAPRPVFDRLVSRLDAEARAHQVAVVSRGTPARYRVRAYLAAKVDPKRTTIAWVWDVYDSDLRRAVRIAGEETADRNREDAWAAADDQVVARIAGSGMTQLAALAAAAGHAPSPAAPSPAAPSAPVGPTPAPQPESVVQIAAATPPAASADGRGH